MQCFAKTAKGETTALEYEAYWEMNAEAKCVGYILGDHARASTEDSSFSFCALGHLRLAPDSKYVLRA